MLNMWMIPRKDKMLFVLILCWMAGVLPVPNEHCAGVFAQANEYHKILEQRSKYNEDNEFQSPLGQPTTVCPPPAQSTCDIKSLDTLSGVRTCDCDSSCVDKGTCCKDSSFIKSSLQYMGRTCGVGWIFGISRTPNELLFVSTCNPSWNGSSETIELCEGLSTAKGNFLMAIPVNSLESGYIYPNYFCAVCNSDHHNAVFWNVTITRNQKVEFLDFCEGDVEQDLVYNQNLLTWGYWNYYLPDEAIFVSVDIQITLNDDSHDWISGNKCRNEWSQIRSCAVGWENDTVKQQCESKDEPVIEPWKYAPDGYYRQRTFRNVYCAMCNNVIHLDELICASTVGRGEGGYGGGGIDGVTITIGRNLKFKPCGRKGKSVKNLKGCRPVIQRQ